VTAPTVKGRRASDKVQRQGKIRRLIFGIVVAAGVLTVAILLWPTADDVATAYDGAPSWSPDSQRLVFSAERDGQTDILVMSADGTGRRTLTTHAAEDGAPTFSPDGRRIAFETSRDGNFEIYTMDAEGHSLVRVTNHAATDRSPAWSPDGRRIAFLSDRARRPNFDVYIMNADGSGLERLTTTDTFWAPQFAPDGNQLAVQGNSDIRVINLTDKAVKRLTFDPQNGMSPSWSPDGSRIAFASTRNGRLEIFTMHADGSHQDMLMSMPGASVLAPRWSPAGSRVAFVQVPTLEGEAAKGTVQPYAIYVIEIESRRVRRLSP
jgi:Tol biopolymer transport system component